MTQDRFDKVLKFLRDLDRMKIYYELAHYMEDGISVVIAVPGQRWEVDFLEDGSVYVERFVSNGHIDDESAFIELFAKFSDEEAPVTHDATART
ncbi:MAG TPA: hypothetical protein DDY78_02025 [Planctomycetales bacterium]|jgi:hypothetical protein|nr:hypothetical protein [Planctomycetales bacterium]